MRRALAFSLALSAACAPAVRAGSNPGADAGTNAAPASDAGRDAAASDAGEPTISDAGTDAGEAPSPPDAGTPGGGVATIRVHYDTGPGHAITVRGSGAGLSWTSGASATWTSGNVWVLALPVAAPIEFKPLVDDQTWAIGPNWTLAPGQTADVWPFFFTQAGTVTTWSGFPSAILGNSRDIWVYTPPSYGENAAERYPVVYMHDGQNLFTDQYSLSGVGWNVQGAMDQGAQDGTIREAIVVGIDNTDNRIWEYTPTNGGMDGGGASQYLDFVVQELKPAVDQELRTLPDCADTYVVGSSLGGLVSCYAGLVQPQAFGSIGALSPSTWWDGDWIVAQVLASADGGLAPIRTYVDSGDAGPDDDDSTDTALLAAAYQATGTDLDYLVQPDGQHSEVYWRQRIPGALAFLLGPRP